MMHQRFMGHQSYVLLCTETTLSNHPEVFPKLSCDVNLLRCPCIKSSSNISLPFAWITCPRKPTQLHLCISAYDHHSFILGFWKVWFIGRVYLLWSLSRLLIPWIFCKLHNPNLTFSNFRLILRVERQCDIRIAYINLYFLSTNLCKLFGCHIDAQCDIRITINYPWPYNWENQFNNCLVSSKLAKESDHWIN